MDKQELSIIATVKAKEGQEAFVRDALIKLLVPVRQEEGCINYFLHEDLENPHCFVLYENWASRELWQKHMEGTNLEIFTKATQDALATWTLQELQKYNA